MQNPFLEEGSPIGNENAVRGAGNGIFGYPQPGREETGYEVGTVSSLLLPPLQIDFETETDLGRRQSVGSLFRVGTEYDRRELRVKEKEVPRKTEEFLYRYALFLIEGRARAIAGSVCAVIPRSNNMTPGTFPPESGKRYSCPF
jgi:hypothetical protein